MVANVLFIYFLFIYVVVICVYVGVDFIHKFVGIIRRQSI